MPGIIRKSLIAAGVIVLLLWMAALTWWAEMQYRSAVDACLYAYSVDDWRERMVHGAELGSVSSHLGTPDCQGYFKWWFFRKW